MDAAVNAPVIDLTARLREALADNRALRDEVQQLRAGLLPGHNEAVTQAFADGYREGHADGLLGAVLLATAATEVPIDDTLTARRAYQVGGAAS